MLILEMGYQSIAKVLGAEISVCRCVAGTYALPLTDVGVAWTLFTAAVMSDSNVRDNMVTQIWNFISKNASGNIFPTSFALDGLGSALNNTRHVRAGNFRKVLITEESVSSGCD